ncbi:TRAP transporter small permease subunit, partial [Desulfobacterales bacterium HSG16]|nr:TRAP transporter small permease subunit [Desulfobacterales bacterium HSG16]
GMHYMFGMAYTDVHDSHVKVDIFSSRMPKKIQHILAIATTLIIFLPVISCMAIFSCTFAFTSLQGLERNSTSWGPPIWPLKIIMAITFIFLLAQGISNLIKDVRALISEQ